MHLSSISYSPYQGASFALHSRFGSLQYGSVAPYAAGFGAYGAVAPYAGYGGGYGPYVAPLPAYGYGYGGGYGIGFGRRRALRQYQMAMAQQMALSGCAQAAYAPLQMELGWRAPWYQRVGAALLGR